MATDLATLRSGARTTRDVPHTVSPGLWTLAWRRLRSDGVGMVSLGIVGLFILMMILSGTGLIARDWAREIGVNYAPPSWAASGNGPGADAPAAGVPGAATPNASAGSEYKSSVVDPGD